MRYVTEGLDCCPAPAKLAPVLRALKRETGCTYQSIYRGTDARAQLNACGKHDQAWLYAHLPRGQANPPGRSTHELRNDGVAFGGWVGMPLRWWQCGIDLDDAHVARFIAAAHKHGFLASVTYPGSRVEYHHVNFRREPKLHLFPTLKKNSKGPRVRRLSRRLRFVRNRKNGQPYLKKLHRFYGKDVERAVKRFQEDHKLPADGVYGALTAKQLGVAVRREKKRRK